MDAEGGQLNADGVGECNEGGFGCAVDGAVGNAAESGDGGDVDNAASATGLHVGHDGLCAVERAEEVRGHQGGGVGESVLCGRVHVPMVPEDFRSR